ncbi:MAG: hypothetical protein ACLR23_12850 [Clostridia bacterium]
MKRKRGTAKMRGARPITIRGGEVEKGESPPLKQERKAMKQKGTAKMRGARPAIRGGVVKARSPPLKTGEEDDETKEARSVRKGTAQPFAAEK